MIYYFLFLFSILILGTFLIHRFKINYFFDYHSFYNQNKDFTLYEEQFVSDLEARKAILNAEPAFINWTYDMINPCHEISDLILIKNELFGNHFYLKCKKCGKYYLINNN